MPDSSSLKESLLYAFWRVCGLVNLHRDMLNARYRDTEPAVLIVTTALVTYIGQRAVRRIVYGEGFVPNVRRGFLATLRSLPIVRDYVREKMDTIALDVERSLNKFYADCHFILELPEKRWTPEAILEEMDRNDGLCKVDWKKGVVSGAIYTEHDPRLEAMMISVYERHLRSNPLHSDVFVGVRKMEAEVIRWCCKIFHGGPDSCGSGIPAAPLRHLCGCIDAVCQRFFPPWQRIKTKRADAGMILLEQKLETMRVSSEPSLKQTRQYWSLISMQMTSGGTESLILACKAHRDYGYFEKGIVYPEIFVCYIRSVMCSYSMAKDGGAGKWRFSRAVVKRSEAGEYLRIKVIHIPVDPETMKADVQKMKAAITGNTIMLVGSAPQFPHGCIDPIQEIAELGVKYNIPVHVDACLGGFLVPFMDDAGFPLPPFDFRLDGVTSISADTHKRDLPGRQQLLSVVMLVMQYGYTPKGSSMVMYRSRKHHHYQFSVATDWPGGVYATPTMSGSRPGSVAACTWASLLYYGREGYVEATRKIITTTRKIVNELHTVPGIKVLGSPDVSVVAVGSDEFDIFQLLDKLSHRGWNLNPLQYPSGFHLCVTLLHVAENVAEQFVSDIRECTADIMQAPRLPSSGKAAIYGMAQSIPDRSVIEELACAYIDACYSTRYLPSS